MPNIGEDAFAPEDGRNLQIEVDGERIGLYRVAYAPNPKGLVILY